MEWGSPKRGFTFPDLTHYSTLKMEVPNSYDVSTHLPNSMALYHRRHHYSKRIIGRIENRNFLNVYYEQIKYI
jgi:hypothetical protein